MHESDQVSHKAISVYDSIKQFYKFKSTKVNNATLGNKLEFAQIQDQNYKSKSKLQNMNSKIGEEKKGREKNCSVKNHS